MIDLYECYAKAAQIRQVAAETADHAYRRIFERIAADWETAAVATVLQRPVTWYGFHIPVACAAQARR